MEDEKTIKDKCQKEKQKPFAILNILPFTASL